MFELTDKNRLYWLMAHYMVGDVSTKEFCDEYYKCYDLELPLGPLTACERDVFLHLSDVVGRYSPYEEECYVGSFHLSENDVKSAIAEAQKALEVEPDGELFKATLGFEKCVKLLGQEARVMSLDETHTIQAHIAAVERNIHNQFCVAEIQSPVDIVPRVQSCFNGHKDEEGYIAWSKSSLPLIATNLYSFLQYYDELLFVGQPIWFYHIEGRYAICLAVGSIKIFTKK